MLTVWLPMCSTVASLGKLEWISLAMAYRGVGHGFTSCSSRLPALALIFWAAAHAPHVRGPRAANLLTRFPMYAPAPLSPYLPRVCRWLHAVLSAWSPSSFVSRLCGVLHMMAQVRCPWAQRWGGAPACLSTQQHACTALTCTCGRTHCPPAGRASDCRASACKASPCVRPTTSHIHT